jgi:hypothetical protein
MAFVESTSNLVTIDEIKDQEIQIGKALKWRFDFFITNFEWASWFMSRWDNYVDETLSYLKSQYDLKFYDFNGKNYNKYSLIMQFVDLASIHEKMH